VARGEPGQQFDWEKVFARYTAAVDNPASCVWRELMVAYPEAKVILTLHPRGSEAWYESTVETIYFTESKWQFKVLELTTPFGRKMGELCHKLIWGRAHRGTMRNRAEAIAFYQHHIEEVKAAVPPDRLLVFSVDQGWKPLCSFLGVPEPGAPFPNVNDRTEIKAAIQGMTRGAYVILTAIALVAVTFIAMLVGLLF